MLTEIELHLAYKTGNTSINNFPFPHMFIKDIFPNDFYSKIQENLPNNSSMTSLPDLYPEQPGFMNYKERFAIDFKKIESINKIEKHKQDFWKAIGELFMKGELTNFLRTKFQHYLDMRFKLISDLSFQSECLLINDKKNYSLGPHTDSPKKVISLLIYLPKDMKQMQNGTSLYIPKDPNFISNNKEYGHFSHEEFHKVMTMPFLPNSAFCFIKTNNSFHGVEKMVMEETDRWLLLFDIFLNEKSYLNEKEAKEKYLKEKEAEK